MTNRSPRIVGEPMEETLGDDTKGIGREKRSMTDGRCGIWGRLAGHLFAETPDRDGEGPRYPGMGA